MYTNHEAMINGKTARCNSQFRCQDLFFFMADQPELIEMFILNGSFILLALHP